MGDIGFVDINDKGIAIVAGSIQNNSAAYFVYPNAAIKPLNISSNDYNVFEAKINNQTEAFLVGVGFSIIPSSPFVARISSNGKINFYDVSFAQGGTLWTLDANDKGVAIVGGQGFNSSTLTYYPLAFFVENNIVYQFQPESMMQIYGIFNSVAINDTSKVILVGQNSDTSKMYGALASFATGSYTEISNLSNNQGTLLTADINDIGVGMVGGAEYINQIYYLYAAKVSNNAVANTLDLGQLQGSINSVATNNAGQALICGYVGNQMSSYLYAAMISPDNRINVLFNSDILGEFVSADINEAGIGLLGGSYGASGYAYLVAPNGTLTQINVASQIYGVALLSAQAPIDKLVPKTAGPFTSAIYTQLSATNALETRFIQQNRLWNKSKNNQNITANEFDTSDLQVSLSMNPAIESGPKDQMKVKKNSIWLEPFGDFVYLKKQGSIPKYSNEIGGFLLGYDRQDTNYIVGTTAGYAYNYIDSSSINSHTNLQEEMLSFYGAYYSDYFWISSAIWGGLYQFTTKLSPISEVTAKGSSNGWLLQPHLELAGFVSLNNTNSIYLEPFVSLDWVNNWQSSYTEKGRSGLNLDMPSVYNSLLQSEVGIRFYENIGFNWGNLQIEEKLSYINQAPFGDTSVNTAFVSSAASFPVAVASSDVQNLGTAQMMLAFVPKKTAYPTGGLSFQGSWGTEYQSYFVSIFLGKSF